jgi:hypothetical protein
MKLIETHIEVEDVEKSLNLYKKLIPHKDILRWADDKVAAIVLEDGSAFGIWKKGHKGIHNGLAGQKTHFAFKIEKQEYETYVNLITDCNLEPLEHNWDNGYKSVYFFDYDGHQGEFMTGNWIELNDL